MSGGPRHRPLGAGPRGQGSTEEHRDPLIVYANFASDLAISPSAQDPLTAWAEQAPRKIWLTRPGDVLVSPAPLSADFRRYAEETLGLPRDSVEVLTAPPEPGLLMGDTVRRGGLVSTLRALAAERPGVRLLPLALDTSAVGLAAELGVPVAPYGPEGPPAEALAVAYRLNTKTGFRGAAAELGIRVPPGQACTGNRLTQTAASLLARHGRAVIKPDRSAGGYGLRFLTREDGGALPDTLRSACGGSATGTWVVEQWLDVARSVSVQMETSARVPRVLFTGEMRTTGGAFTGYVSPLEGAADPLVHELERWGAALGEHLASHGYAGPYSLDAVVADGVLFATESNVRRTATTTPYVMAARLGRRAGLAAPAWLIGKGRSARAHTFAGVLGLLGTTGLGWDPGRGAGIVLYGDAPADGRSWRYAAIGPDGAGVAELETALTEVMELGP